MWQVRLADEAIDLAERDARLYAGDNAEYLEVRQSYALFDDVPASGIEVFSLFRECDLEADAYVDAFFDTGDGTRRLPPRSGLSRE